MMIKLLIPFYLSLFCLSTLPRHEFYVSITELDIKGDTLQVAIKVFTHDLEEVLKDETAETVFLDNTTDMDKSMRIIKEYASENISFGNASSGYDLIWVGHEYEADVTWIYAYALIDPNSSLLFVRNTLLTTDRRNQHNMVHLNHKNKIESRICTAQGPEARFTL
ncbi:MAG: hypothetical protein Salg2KO_19010 [Salibacteraceae bacterium]